jgi:hypothetical protein
MCILQELLIILQVSAAFVVYITILGFTYVVNIFEVLQVSAAFVVYITILGFTYVVNIFEEIFVYRIYNEEHIIHGITIIIAIGLLLAISLYMLPFMLSVPCWFASYICYSSSCIGKEKTVNFSKYEKFHDF